MNGRSWLMRAIGSTVDRKTVKSLNIRVSKARSADRNPSLTRVRRGNSVSHSVLTLVPDLSIWRPLERARKKYDCFAVQLDWRIEIRNNINIVAVQSLLMLDFIVLFFEKSWPFWMKSEAQKKKQLCCHTVLSPVKSLLIQRWPSISMEVPTQVPHFAVDDKV